MKKTIPTAPQKIKMPHIWHPHLRSPKRMYSNKKSTWFSVAIFMGYLSMVAMPVVGQAQGWSYSPPEGEDTPLPSPAPLSAGAAPGSAGSGLYGSQGTAQTNSWMQPNTNALPSQPWQQQFGTPFGSQPYQTMPGVNGPAQPTTGPLAPLKKPAAASDTKKKEEKKTKKEDAPVSRVTVVSIGDKFRGIGRAVTGDTISVQGQRLHLLGLHAPAIAATCQAGVVSWRCGEDSRDSLDNLLSSQGDVDCIVVATGTTPEATCRQAGEDISRPVVASGMVTTAEPRLVDAMLEARNDRRGLWTDPNFPPPLPTPAGSQE